MADDLKTALEVWSTRGTPAGAIEVLDRVEAQVNGDIAPPLLSDVPAVAVPTRRRPRPLVAFVAAAVIAIGAVGSVVFLTRGTDTTPNATTPSTPITPPPPTEPPVVEPLGSTALPTFPITDVPAFVGTMQRDGATLRITYAGPGKELRVEVVEQWSTAYSATAPFGDLAEGDSGSIYVFDGEREHTFLARDNILERHDAREGFAPIGVLDWHHVPLGVGDLCERTDHTTLGVEEIAGRVAHVITCTGLGEDLTVWVDAETGLLLKVVNGPGSATQVVGDFEFTAIMPNPSFRSDAFDAPDQAGQVFDAETDVFPQPPSLVGDWPAEVLAERELSRFRQMSEEMFTLGGATLTGSMPGPSDLQRGQEVPPLTGTFLDGTPFDINDYRGAPLVILSWSPHLDAVRIPDSWTPNEDLRVFEQVVARWGDEVQFLSLIRSYEEPAADPDLAAEILATLGVSVPVIIPSDGTGWDYAPGAPFNTWLLIDENGHPVDGFYNYYPVMPVLEVLLSSLDDPPVTTGTWDAIQTSAGIPGDCALTVEAGAGDQVWAAGRCGIWLLEGSTATPMTPPDPFYEGSNSVDIAVGTDGSTWFGSSNGLYRYDGDEWETYAGHYESITVDLDGTVWAVDRDTETLWTLDRNNWVQQDRDGVYTVAAAPDGAIWISINVPERWLNENTLLQAHGELQRFDGADWTTWGDVPQIREVSSWLAAFADGSVWMSDSAGLVRFDGQSTTRWDYQWTDLSGAITDAARDRHGRTWLATAEGAYLSISGPWIHFTLDNGLVSDDLTSVTVTPDGTVWFGTTDSGIIKYTPNT